MDWLSPWYPTNDEETAAGLARQLAIEVGPKHTLYGQTVRLLARREDTDDALFALDDGRVAEVHMTWRKTAEPDPRWPATAIHTSLEDWQCLIMQPLHAELAASR